MSGQERPARSRQRGARRFVVWMYAPHARQWTMPASSLVRIREALGGEWEVDSIEVGLDATGDGARDTPAEVLEAVASAEVYCGWGIRPEALRAGRHLRWVHSGAAGVRASLFEEMRTSDVLLTNSAGMYSGSIAEHALATILYFSRAFDVAVRAQQTAEWAQTALTGPESPLLGSDLAGEIAGATLGVIGYGGIGRALGIRAHALGMRVQAIRRTPGALPPELVRLEEPGFLSRLLETSDFVALTAPETPETRQLLGAEQFGLMKSTAVFINLARGSMIDEQALLRVLMERRLRGAALDVFQAEPLPADHPLWKLDNVLITPHVGGTSGRFWERETDLIVRNIHRYLAGEELENRVGKERGY